jgi:hypothetical protein
LKPDRLADVIAAIQALAANEEYYNLCERWAHIISGDEGKAAHWKEVFDDHPEFFRSTRQLYSLIWRRTLPHIEKATGEIIYNKAYKEATSKLDDDQKRQAYGRPQLQDTQVSALIGIAIDLHKDAVARHRDWRWWTAPAASFVATVLAAVIAFLAAWAFPRQ